MAMMCAGCRQKINDRRFMKCSFCGEHYDLECAGISEMRFHNTMSIERKMTWKCHLCRSKVPKADNSNTPIRPPQPLDNLRIPGNQEEQNLAHTSTTDMNVTMRKRSPCYNISIDSDEDFTVSPQGNTQPISTRGNQSGNKNNSSSAIDDEQISLHKFKSILHENNKEIIRSIQNSFRDEIESAISKIKAEFTQTFDKISGKQIQFQQDLINTNKKIQELEQGCHALRVDFELIQTEIRNIQANLQTSALNPDSGNTDRVFVLHGFVENQWETEEEVIERVIHIFYDLLNINLYEYIEEATFIGRKGNRRPLKIELISKRMKKFIIDNSMYLKEAGLSATEYLSPSALQIRRKLNHSLQVARRNGQHAVIRNNKLIINGQESATFLQMTENRNKSNTSIHEDKEEKFEDQQSTTSLPTSSPYLHSSQGIRTGAKSKNNISKIPNFRQ